MLNRFKTFRAEDDGAITVDWVVLTAALVGLGVAVILTIGSGATDRSAGLGNHLETMDGPDFGS